MCLHAVCALHSNAGNHRENHPAMIVRTNDAMLEVSRALVGSSPACCRLQMQLQSHDLINSALMFPHVQACWEAC